MFKEYFNHDYNARLDFKVRTLRSRMGFEGYGLFWVLIEELYCNDGALPLDGIEVLAKCYNVRASKLRSVVMDFGLFVIDEEAGTFSSHRVGETLSRRKAAEEERKASAANRSAAAKTAAAARWGARGADAEQSQCADDANAMPLQSEDDTEATRPQCEDDASAMRPQCEDDAIKRREEKRRESITEVASATSTSAPAEADAEAEAEEAAGALDGMPPSEAPTASGEPPANEPEDPPPSASHDDAVSAQLYWNEKSGLGKISKLRNNRLKMLKARIRENGLPGVMEMIDRVAASDFLHGGGGRGFTANFDWCIKPNNYDKIIAGNYDNRPKGVGGVAVPPGFPPPISNALAGWEYPAAAYGVRPTDAEVREELRHREVLNYAYNLIAGGSPGG